MEPRKTTNKHSWVKGPLHKRPSNIPPHNDGPYTGQFNGVPGDYVGRTDLAKTLPDDEECKIGAPFIGALGAQQRGKCVYCRNPIFMTPTMLECPYCRRQLTLDAPGYDSSTYNKGLTDNKMLDNGIPEDFHKGPTQNELQHNLDQYSGGGPAFNDVKGRKT